MNFNDKIWDFYDKLYDTFSQNWIYFGEETVCCREKPLGNKRVYSSSGIHYSSSSSLIVIMVHGYYQRSAISLAPSSFLVI